MEKTWIVVANASRATIYNYTSSKNKPELTVVEELIHPDSRKKDSELVSDREGEYRAAGGHGNFNEASDPHQYEAVVFARELSQKLEQAKSSQQYQALILVAAPRFMGLLRQSLNDRLFHDISIQEFQKDYTLEPQQELIKLLNLK
jgi:protein required for attachment to host cells